MTRTKAPNGVPTIKPVYRKDGTVARYTTQVTLKLPNGMSKRQGVSGATQAECLKNAMNVRKEYELGGLLRNKPITVPQLVDRWLMEACDYKTGSTMRLYKGAQRLYIKPLLSIRASALNPARLHTFLCDTAAKVADGNGGRDGLASAHVAYIVLKAATKWGARRDVGALQDGVDPLADATFSLGKGWNKRRDYIPLHEAGLIVKAAQDRPSQLLWRLLLATGARRGEILGLNVGDVDPREWLIRINKIATPESDGAETKPRTKGRTNRSVPIDDEGLREDLLVAMTGKKPGEPLFESPNGGRLRHTTASKWWQRDLAAAGLTGYTTHQLRHTFATLALADGVPVNVVSEILGHASAAITLSVYGHVAASQKSDAVRRVSSLIARAIAT
jgi:integrase